MARTLAEAARRLNARHPAADAPGLKPPYLLFLTDSRLSRAEILAAVARLPRGAGVIVRHTDPVQRRDLAHALAPLCRARGVALLVAGDWRLAARLGAGVHLAEAQGRRGVLAPLLGWQRQRGKWLSMACHSAAALHCARRLGADLALLSPVLPTRSHPGARPLGTVRTAGLIGGAGRGLRVIALGGMTAHTVGRLTGCGAWGVAAIDGVIASGPGPESPPATG